MNFRSSVVLDALCVHECAVIGEGGLFWPAATFCVTAMDRAEEPLLAKSCTGCWSQVCHLCAGSSHFSHAKTAPPSCALNYHQRRLTT